MDEATQNEIASLRRTIGSCYERGERLSKALREAIDYIANVDDKSGYDDLQFIERLKREL